MLRFSHALWLAVPAALLGGCPVYSDGCITREDCDQGYACDHPTGTCQLIAIDGAPGPARCLTTDDCDVGLVCDRYSRCVEPSGEGGASGQGGTGGQGGASP
jgi:hypothetical protein